ncbi:thiol:disulfide interchange protein [candidate division KSB1 bacterium]|nr:MAG: thiol:disulfide interchange protein [candidate division KSB1 bacterium]
MAWLPKFQRHAKFHNALLALLLTLVLFDGVASRLWAQFGQASHIKVKLISEAKWASPGETVWLAVEMKAQPDWHIYWRNFGDTGMETTFEFDLPKGVKAGQVQWPYPEKITAADIVSYGYSGDQYFLVPLTVDKTVKPGTVLHIKAHVGWLECADVCIPGETDVALELPVKNQPVQADEKYVQLFSDARFRIPKPLTDWKVAVKATDNAYIIQLIPPQWFKGTLKELYFYPYDTDVVKYKEEQTLKKKGSSLLLTVPKAGKASVDTLKGVLVAEPGWRGAGSEKSAEIKVAVTKKLLAAPKHSEISSIWLAILFSFLGGMILNLMPCVLPVLSIKIMRFVKQAQDKKAKPWKHGVLFTIGVLLAFWTLAIALLILKAGGEQLGWGFQLQSPTFLIILSVFMFLLGLSMFGVFEIGTSLTTVGGAVQSEGWFGSLMDGVIATIVATPCTAPFMGGALGFALTQPAWVSLIVFTFLGLGMAFPFALITSIPALLKYVPKPGRWMESLKQFMGFLLVATVIWLLWVLGQQTGSVVLVLVLLDLLLTSVAAWIYGRWGNLAMEQRTRIIAWVLALLILGVSNWYVLENYHKYEETPSVTSISGEIDWQPYSDQLLQQLLDEGKPVFVDFTAKWCLSCQANEQITFSSEEVQKKFKELGIVALKADWTKRNPEITQALAKFGRMSVPLYVLYPGRKDADPQLLPEVITPGIVLQALESVKK